MASMGANAFGAQFEHRVSGSLSHDSMATISVSLSRANAGEAGTTLSSAVTVMGCGLSTARPPGPTLRDPVRIQLPQSPARLRGLREALHQVGEPRVLREERQRLLQLLGAGCASVEVVVDRDDSGGEGDLDLALPLMGEPQAHQDARIGPPPL